MQPNAIRIAMGRLHGKDPTAYRFMHGHHDKRQWSPAYCARETAVYWHEKESHWSKVGKVVSCQVPDNLPRYLDDRNEAAAVWAALPRMTRQTAASMLYNMLDGGQQILGPTTLTDAVMSSTPAQQCEAILRASDLWTEDSP